MDDLKDPLLKDPLLGKSLLHNRFGCYCLQGNFLKKALNHFTKALDLLENKTFFTNIYQNMGNVYAQQRDYDEAIKFYQMVLDFSPHNPENKDKYHEISSEILSNKSINSYDAYVDAHTNLAVMHLTKNETEKALKFCSKALELKKDNFEAAVNFGDILRQVGHREEALNFTWDLITKYTNTTKPEMNYEAPKQIIVKQHPEKEEKKEIVKPHPENEEKKEIVKPHPENEEKKKIVKPYPENEEKKENPENNHPENSEEKKKLPTKYEEEEEKDNVNILCVKWGTRYNSEYVNKLYRGIKRNTTKKFIFHCFTEDPVGLMEGINIIKLKEDWKGWWGKATLFSRDYGLDGKMFYIDLDMIVTGNIDDLLSYQGEFGILKTDSFACEKNNKSGYNSSILIWNNTKFEAIYLELKENFEAITKFIVRFDFWLEMMVKNADFLQDLYPAQIADYLSICKEKLEENTRIVCFPRTPKPDACDSEWIKTHWI